GLGSAIDGCLDSRAKVIDTASRRLSALRREIAQVEERIQDTLNHMIRSADVRRSLRFPNFTMVGHHYVLPVSKDHRGEIEGAVLRTSASNETVYIEPRAIGPALVPPRPRGEGDPPHPAVAQRAGGPGVREPARHAGDHGRTGPDPRTGPAGRRLSDVGPSDQPGGASGAPGRSASLA